MDISIVRTLAELRTALAPIRQGGTTIGFVPTMGALHAGHVSLIQAARRECGFVVVSIFVNPTQFGPQEDFQRYPRPFAEDVRLAADAMAAMVYAPAAPDLYPAGFQTYVEVEGLSQRLEGASRPGHFRGVATVVLKLINRVQPDVAFFGQKDAQQVRVIQQMVRDLDVPVRITVCPTVRQPDGLALSSRNAYLTAEQRAQATVLYKALTTAERQSQQGELDAGRLRSLMTELIQSAPDATLDYVAIVDPESFLPVERVENMALALLAVRFGATRLIDNLWLRAGRAPSGGHST